MAVSLMSMASICSTSIQGVELSALLRTHIDSFSLQSSKTNHLETRRRLRCERWPQPIIGPGCAVLATQARRVSNQAAKHVEPGPTAPHTSTSLRQFPCHGLDSDLGRARCFIKKRDSCTLRAHLGFALDPSRPNAPQATRSYFLQPPRIRWSFLQMLRRFLRCLSFLPTSSFFLSILPFSLVLFPCVLPVFSCC